MLLEIPGSENDVDIDPRFAGSRRATNAGSALIRAGFRTSDELARKFHVLFTTLGCVTPLLARVPRRAWRRYPLS
jgi:hypothetical protein